MNDCRIPNVVLALHLVVIILSSLVLSCLRVRSCVSTADQEHRLHRCCDVNAGCDLSALLFPSFGGHAVQPPRSCDRFRLRAKTRGEPGGGKGVLSVGGFLPLTTVPLPPGRSQQRD